MTEHKASGVPDAQEATRQASGSAVAPKKKRQRFSDVVSAAVEAALSTYELRDQSPMTCDAEHWYAMYHAQSTATDAFAKKAAAKSDKALLERIAELENQIEKVNSNFARLNDLSVGLAPSRVPTGAAAVPDDVTTPVKHDEAQAK